jgi:N-acyl-D-amino-acid deacylase
MGDPCDPHFWYELQRAGAFPTFFRMYREAGVAVEEIVRRNTSLVAEHFGLAGRGRIAPGCHADVAVIDPARYAFPAPHAVDPRDPTTTASGVECVLVNGRIVLDGGNVTVARPGRVLRRGDA